MMGWPKLEPHTLVYATQFLHKRQEKKYGWTVPFLEITNKIKSEVICGNKFPCIYIMRDTFFIHIKEQIIHKQNTMETS